jgi:hypothetical protein
MGFLGQESMGAVGTISKEQKGQRMIRSISAGPGLGVAGGTVSYPCINMNNTSAGMVRYNGNTQNFEVYDGSTWMTMYSSAATVTLDYDVQNILNWAKDKMAEDLRLKELAQKHPGIADLQEKLEVMIALVQQQEKV